MSLKEEERSFIVQLELEKAETTFKEYEGLSEKGYWSTLANRLYYALFHAVSAMLICDGHEVGSHKGAAIRFHQYYVRQGKFSSSEGAFYSQMETLREKADYNCFFQVAEDDIVGKIEQTRQFIGHVRQYIATLKSPL